MIIPLGLALPGLVGYRAGKFWKYTVFEKYWAYAALSILLYFWWGSTSWQYYNPIALFQRHLLLLVPPLAILAGMSLMRVKEHLGLYANVFAGITLSGFWIQAGPVLLIYALIFGFFAVYWLLQRIDTISQSWSSLTENVFFPVLLCILVIHPVYSMAKPSVSDYAHLAEMVEKLAEEEGNILFITDGQIASNCEYVFRRWQQKPVCMGFSSFQHPALLSDFEKVYVLKYDFHLPSYLEGYHHLMQVLEKNEQHLQPIYSTGKVHVFRVHSSLEQKSED